jgi:hypothetical protein
MYGNVRKKHIFLFMAELGRKVGALCNQKNSTKMLNEFLKTKCGVVCE